MGAASRPETSETAQDDRNGHTETTTQLNAQNSSSRYEPGYDSNGASATEGNSSSVPSSERRTIQAFAKLEFADGDFYMTTYGVDLGRDNDPPLRGDFETWSSTPTASKTNGASSPNLVEDGLQSPSRDFVSSAEAAQENLVNDAPAQLTSSPSAPGSGRRSRRKSRINYNDIVENPEFPVDEAQANEAYPVQMSRYPKVPIHQPDVADGKPVNKKAISRQHARILFNFEKHYFEIEFLGRNGAFLDDEWFAQGDVQPLVSGSIIQIGGCGIRFCLPQTPDGETGAPEGISDELSEGTGEEHGNLELLESEEEDEEEQEGSQDEMKKGVTTRGRKGGAKHRPDLEPEPAKKGRKGPGRPPKDGVMSKRAQKELTKQAKSTNSAVAKRKAKVSGRGKGKTPKAMELEESSIQPSGKRKYTKRKGVGRGAGGRKARESTEKTDSVSPEQDRPSKTPKDKKPPKPPRSPSPVWDEATLTPEQLAKPQANYVILIHEAITNSGKEGMSLPQIYRAIERKYAWFKLRAQTVGWQSSVRHNLGQHAAFVKIKKDGKGWMWGVDLSVSIEKEKKRRATPPLQSSSQPRYYPQSQVQQPRTHTYGYPTAQYPGAQMPPNRQFPQSAMIPPNGYNVPPGMHHGPLPPRPPFAAPAFPIILNARSDDAYQSPYDPSAKPNETTQPDKPRSPTNSLNGFHAPAPNQSQVGLSHYPSGQNGFSHRSNVDQNVSVSGPATANHSNAPSIKYEPPHVQDAIHRFKTKLMGDLEDKVHGEKLIDSAIKRTFDGSIESDLDNDADLREEASIIMALKQMLVSMREQSQSTSLHGSQVFAAQGSRAAEVAKQVAESMPSSGTVVPRNEASVDTSGGDSNKGNVLKHHRSPTADEQNQPQGKRQAL